VLTFDVGFCVNDTFGARPELMPRLGLVGAFGQCLEGMMAQGANRGPEPDCASSGRAAANCGEQSKEDPAI